MVTTKGLSLNTQVSVETYQILRDLESEGTHIIADSSWPTYRIYDIVMERISKIDRDSLITFLTITTRGTTFSVSDITGSCILVSDIEEQQFQFEGCATYTLSFKVWNDQTAI